METEIAQVKTVKKIPKIIWLILLLVVLAAVFLLIQNKNKNQEANQNQNEKTGELVEISRPGEDVISLSQEEIDILPVATLNVENEDLTRIYLDEDYDLGQLRLVAPGANPVTYDEKVINYEGREVKNDAFPMSDSAPRPSDLLNKQNLPEYILQIDIADGKFSPDMFSAKAGQVITFTLTSHDVLAHSLTFDDQQLSGIFMLVGPNQTRAINFKAPQEPGAYTFHCSSYGHPETEIGTMIVTK